MKSVTKKSMDKRLRSSATKAETSLQQLSELMEKTQAPDANGEKELKLEDQMKQYFGLQIAKAIQMQRSKTTLQTG